MSQAKAVVEARRRFSMDEFDNEELEWYYASLRGLGC